MPGGMQTNIGTAFATGINQERLGTVMKLQESAGAEACDIGQVAATIAFVCSDTAGVLNGAEIVADKGWCSF